MPLAIYIVLQFSTASTASTCLVNKQSDVVYSFPFFFISLDFQSDQKQLSWSNDFICLQKLLHFVRLHNEQPNAKAITGINIICEFIEYYKSHLLITRIAYDAVPISPHLLAAAMKKSVRVSE